MMVIINVCMCMCIYVCIHQYLNKKYLLIRMCVYVLISMYMYGHVCMYVCNCVKFQL